MLNPRTKLLYSVPWPLSNSFVLGSNITKVNLNAVNKCIVASANILLIFAFTCRACLWRPRILLFVKNAYFIMFENIRVNGPRNYIENCQNHFAPKLDRKKRN